MDPPKRERKRVVNYAENEYFRQAMKSGSGPRGAGVKFPKMPQLQVTHGAAMHSPSWASPFSEDINTSLPEPLDLLMLHASAMQLSSRCYPLHRSPPTRAYY